MTKQAILLHRPANHGAVPLGVLLARPVLRKLRAGGLSVVQQAEQQASY